MASRHGTGSAATELWPQPQGEVPPVPPGQQNGIPNVARIYDALLGGKDNYGPDRESAQALTAAIPGAAHAARDNRAFLRRAVHYLAAEAGISQFLDIGSGLPTAENTHDVAQAANPAARVVYVDNDPVVLAHARALLADNPNVHVAEGELEYPRELTGRREVREWIDFRRPVAVLLVAVLHFLDDSARPWDITEYLTSKMAPGSFLVVSHVSGDQLTDEAINQARKIYAGFAPGTARSRARIMTFFDGLRLVEPGLVDVAAWRSGREKETAQPTLFWAGVGRKPAAEDDQ